MNRHVEEMFRETKRVHHREVPPDSEWRQIPEFPDFWVSQHNQIFNMKLCKLSALFRTNKNILCVRIYRRGYHFNRSVNKLRRIAFDLPEVPTNVFYQIPAIDEEDINRFMCAECGDAVEGVNLYVHAAFYHKCQDVEIYSAGAGIKEYANVR